MPANDPAPGGIFESLRGLCNGVLALLQNRVELLGVEVAEEKARIVRILVLAGAAIFLANTAILVVTGLIVVLAGENARIAVLCVLGLLYVLAALTACLALRKELRSAPPPFNGTVSELKKDCEWLNPRQ